MDANPHPAWHPRGLWEIHQVIRRCRGSKRPNIQIFWGRPPGRSAPPAERWAVFPSSFNPPTLAHAEILRWALKEGEFDRALLLLDIHHADKETQDGLLEDRALMKKIAFSREPGLSLGVCSHGRFLDKLEALDGLLPGASTWTFLIGADTFTRILDPRFYEEPRGDLGTLFSRAIFIVFQRGGGAGLRAGIRNWTQRGARILEVALSEEVQAIASTRIRQCRAQGHSLTREVAPEVMAFMQETGLYLPSPPNPPLYKARRHILERLFQEGPDSFAGRDMRKEASRLAGSLR